MKILITGSRGFVGGSFGRYAAAAGHEIMGISRSTQPEFGWPGHHLQADAAQADLAPVIRDYRPDVILQSAGSASVAASISDPAADFRATAVTLANVLDSVRRSSVFPLVFFPSSAAVYGNPELLPIAEDAPIKPISPYGFHKATCETLMASYSQCFGLSTVTCRLFSVFGARQRRLLVAELYEKFTGPGDAVELQGTGNETRDFLHIDDLSEALLMLAENAPRQTHVVTNIASGNATSIVEIAEAVRNLTGSSKQVVSSGVMRLGDPLNWRADLQRLRTLIPNWMPHSLLSRLKSTVETWSARFVADDHLPKDVASISA